MKPPELPKRPAARPPPPPSPSVIIAVPAPLTTKQCIAHPRNYNRAPRISTQCVVLHSTEGHEGIKQDDNVAAMFARGDLDPRRSCHYVVDADSATLCVPDELTAWHCGRSGNAMGIGVELCGRARQTRAEWLDTYSLPTLQIAARLVAMICAKYRLPVEVVAPYGLRAGKRGITTHAFISEAFGDSTHTDPGEHFPLGDFIAAARAASSG